MIINEWILHLKFWNQIFFAEEEIGVINKNDNLQSAANELFFDDDFPDESNDNMVSILINNSIYSHINKEKRSKSKLAVLVWQGS